VQEFRLRFLEVFRVSLSLLRKYRL